MRCGSSGRSTSFTQRRAERSTSSWRRPTTSSPNHGSLAASGATFLGVAAWVATPEDVILAKLRWRLESRSEVQWRDCVEIASVQRLDENYLRRWAHLLHVEPDLDDLLETVSRGLWPK